MDHLQTSHKMTREDARYWVLNGSGQATSASTLHSQAVPAIELETAVATAAEGNSDITGKGELWARK